MKTLLLLTALAVLPAFTASAAATQYKADTAATSIHWTGKKKIGSQHNGMIKLKGGSIELTGGNVTGGNFSVDMNSISNDDLKDSSYNAKLVGHLKSDDFFNADKFPTADFKLKKAVAKKSGAFTHMITGDLTIKGVTQEVTFPAKVSMGKDSVTAEAQIPVDRTKWGIKYGSENFFKNLGDKVIENNFLIDLKLQAKKL